MRLDALSATRWAAAGRALANAGVTERAVRTCFGVVATAHVPRAIAAGRTFGEPPPPAAVGPWLAAGGEVSVDAAHRALGVALDDLSTAGLAIRDGDRVRLAVRLVPGGAAITLCDRADYAGDDPVGHPDDSSHHLLGALPDRRPARWLDLGTGAAWAPLAARWRADVCIAADLSPRAIAMGRIGAALAGRDDLDLRVADLAAGIEGPFDLVTCNAPIPGPTDTILSRLWAAMPALVAPDGEAIVHSVLGHQPPPGAVVIARYTPPDVQAFGVTAWRPAGSDRRVAEIVLTEAAPHVTRDSVAG